MTFPHHHARQNACACGGSCPRCQEKSRQQANVHISQPNDAFEREADDVAAKIMTMAGPTTMRSAQAGIQRKCAKCEEEEGEKKLIQTWRETSEESTAALDAGSAVRAAERSGAMLPGDVRSYFEPRFGYDFTRVRIHTDADAADGARAVKARAYTVGSNIVFATGEYSPATTEGKRLLAHELVHVVQQNGGRAASTPPRTGAVQRVPVSNGGEITSSVVAGSPAPAPAGGRTINAVPPQVVQREELDEVDEELIEMGDVRPSTSLSKSPPEFGHVTSEPGCPNVPTGLGDRLPDPPCPQSSEDILGTHFRFCTDSDVFVDQVQLTLLRSFVRSQRADALFKVWGYASRDRPSRPGYNLNLSCHRAKRAARELLMAGVPSQQIQIAARGETTNFGPTRPDNEVVVVGAEEPPKRTSQATGTAPNSLREAVDQAVTRIMARDYRLAADAYVSRWTCGRVPSLAEMVRRTTILLEGQDSRATVTRDPLQEGDPKLGHPNVEGLREIVLAEEILTEASDPVLCAAARIVDMAFHHFLARQLGIGPNDRNTPVHLAALFLVELAGFPPCETPTQIAPGTNVPAIRGQPWWPRPVTDPLAARATGCPADPQPQPFQPGRPLTFTVSDLQPGSGTGLVDPQIDESGNSVNVNPPSGAFSLRAVVQASGDASQFSRYRIGFLQTIVAEEVVAEYVSGDVVHFQLPTPIRDGPPSLVAPPWFMPPLVATLDATGSATTELSDSPSRGFALTFIDVSRRGRVASLPQMIQAGNDLNRGRVRITFHTWVVARRDDAPLDRFSTHFIQGRQIDFSLNLEMIGHRGTANYESRVGATPLTDATPMQLTGPTPADIPWSWQLTQVSPPIPRGQEPGAVGLDDIRAQVKQVADELAPLRTALHLDGPIMVRVRFDRVSGRLVLDIPGRRATTVEEIGRTEDRTGVTETGRQELGRAFTVRLRKDLIAAPSVPDVTQGIPIALNTPLPSYHQRQRQRSDPNPFAHEHRIGPVERRREQKELDRSGEELRAQPDVYDPTFWPEVTVRMTRELYCYDFTVSGLDISQVCRDRSMHTDGCVLPQNVGNFRLRLDPTFRDQRLGTDTFHSPVALEVTTFPVGFVLFTPRESPGGDVFNHEMHHMIDTYNIVQSAKERMARRIRARLMEVRRLAAQHPNLRDELLSRQTILEIVVQENQPFIDHIMREFEVRGDALDRRENQSGLPPYRTKLPRSWTTFREPPFRRGTRGSLDHNPCS